MDNIGQIGLFRRYVPFVVWCLVVTTALLIPMKIREYGYAPVDDAHRHVGKAISGKNWQEILVMRADITIDTNAGWHTILGVLHRSLGWDAEALMSFSIIILFLLVVLMGLPWIRRPEAWMASFFVMNLAIGAPIFRLTRGRPYLFTMSVLIVILYTWTQRKSDKMSPSLMIVTMALLALSVWIHGSWYLLMLPVGAFLLSGRLRDGFRLGICWAIGTIVGAAMTGHPVDFILQQFRWMQDSFGNYELQRQLVTEFRPSTGAYPVVITIVAVLFWKAIRGTSCVRTFRSPIFMLALLGWILGFAVLRFWIDWGMPAAMVWLALEFRDALELNHERRALKRIAITFSVCTALFLSTTSDLGGRWTDCLATKYLSSDEVDLADWLPDEGGTLYSSSMSDFYRTFYKNPHANWRYILGFEPTIMPEEDLAIFKYILRNYRIPESYSAWVAKMRPQDRLLFSEDPDTKPDIPELEWYYGTGGTWIGRLPREVGGRD